jgi:hypothetical protein
MDISIAFRASSGRHLFSSSPQLSEGRDTPLVGESITPCTQPNQSTRERWNLQPSFFTCLMVQVGCHKGGKFLFLFQSFQALIRVFGTADVGFHILSYRDGPRREEGVTGSEPVTNILLQINADTYNAAHVGTPKNATAAAEPFTSRSATAGANPFIHYWSRLSVILTSHLN